MGICPVRGDGVGGPPFSLRQCSKPLILSHPVQWFLEVSILTHYTYTDLSFLCLEWCTHSTMASATKDANIDIGCIPSLGYM